MSLTISSQTQPGKVPSPQIRDAGLRTDVKLEARLTLAGASTQPGSPTPPGDKVTLGAPVEPPATYGNPRLKPTVNAAELNAILAESDAKTQAVMDLILPLIEQQGLNMAKVVSGEQKLSADPAAIEKAKAAVADDGEFGVQQVADSILSFAKASMGGDPAKLATFRAAVEDGFKQAAEMLGGTLPEISEKTRTTIMAQFDRWEADGFDAGAPATPATDA